MDRIWLSQYQEGVPADIDVHAIDKNHTLLHLLQESCRSYASRPAFTNLGIDITYQQLWDYSRHFGNFLWHELGVRPGDRVAIMLPNLLQYPIALFGVFHIGAIVVNVNPLYKPDELENQLNDADCHTVVVLANMASVLEQVLARTNVKKVIVTELADLFPFPRNWLINTVVKYVKPKYPGSHIAGAYRFKDAIKPLAKAFPTLSYDADSIAFLQYTGGTTGLAKGAMLSHRNMLSNTRQVDAWVTPALGQSAQSSEQEIVITALPLYHIFSLLANGLLFLSRGGHNILITNPRDLDGFIKELSRYPFHIITGVNTLYNALLRHPKFAQLDFSHMKIALAGGMALQQSVAENWQKVTGCPLIQAYGLTETSPGAIINPLTATSFSGSIGLPISSTEIKICDDNFQELAVGIEGELCIKGPQVMVGYWRQPQETAHVIQAGGWLKTGDIARVDATGFVYLVDRKKDMILVSGFNVYPNEIEAVVSALAGVGEVAAVGVPDVHSGESVKLYIVKSEASLTADIVVNYCREHLSDYKLPKQIEFRDELPKTNVGKILRRALRDETRI